MPVHFHSRVPNAFDPNGTLLGLPGAAGLGEGCGRDLALGQQEEGGAGLLVHVGEVGGGPPWEGRAAH